MSTSTAPRDARVDQLRVGPIDTREVRLSAAGAATGRRPFRLIPLISAALLWLTAAVVAWLALRTVTGQQLDEWALEDAHAFESSGIAALLGAGLDLIPLIGVIGCALAALIAGLRTRRVSSAAIVLVAAVLSVVSVQVLKLAVLDKPDLGIQAVASNSFPSGHASVAGIVSCMLVIAVPAWLRGWTALAGAAFTALVGAATVLTSWHRPADVVAAVLVSAGWTVLAAALLPGDAPAASMRSGAARASTFPTVIGIVLGVASLAVATALGIAQVWWQGPWAALGAGLMAIVAVALLALAVVAAGRTGRRAASRR